MFGYSLIKTEEFKRLRDADIRVRRVHLLVRWFSGWKDLDIIWNYIFKGDGFMDHVRMDYARARNTNEYGAKLIQPGGLKRAQEAFKQSLPGGGTSAHVKTIFAKKKRSLKKKRKKSTHE